MTVETIAFGNKHTPQQVLIDAMDAAKTAKVAIVIMLSADDYVTTSWSDGSMLMRMGMTDVAKLRMLDASEEENEHV